MTNYQVHVTIENKPGISDPEGKTILNDLVLNSIITIFDYIYTHTSHKIRKWIQKKCDLQCIIFL